MSHHCRSEVSPPRRNHSSFASTVSSGVAIGKRRASGVSSTTSSHAREAASRSGHRHAPVRGRRPRRHRGSRARRRERNWPPSLRGSSARRAHRRRRPRAEGRRPDPSRSRARLTFAIASLQVGSEAGSEIGAVVERDEPKIQFSLRRRRMRPRERAACRADDCGRQRQRKAQPARHGRGSQEIYLNAFGIGGRVSWPGGNQRPLGHPVMVQPCAPNH